MTVDACTLHIVNPVERGEFAFFGNIVQIAPNLIQGPPGHAKRLFPPFRPDMYVHIHRTHTKIVQIHIANLIETTYFTPELRHLASNDIICGWANPF